jgi:hypothetical protein
MNKKELLKRLKRMDGVTKVTFLDKLTLKILVENKEKIEPFVQAEIDTYNDEQPRRKRLEVVYFAHAKIVESEPLISPMEEKQEEISLSAKNEPRTFPQQEETQREFYKKFNIKKKEKKKKDKKLTQQKAYHSKYFLRFSIGAFVFFLVLGTLGLIQGYYAQMKLENVKQEVRAVKQLATSTDEYKGYNPRLSVYLQDFVGLYLTRSKEGNLEKQQMQLNAFLAENVKVELSSSATTQTIQKAQFFGLKTENGVTIATFNVKVAVESVQEKKQPKVLTTKDSLGKETKKTVTETVKVPVKKEISYLLHVPYRQEGENIRVIDLPYIEPNEVKNKQMDGLKVDLADEKQLQDNERVEVEKFLNDFFVQFAKSTSKEMQYMMKEPKGMNNLVTFSKLEDELFLYRKGNSVFVNGAVLFKLTDTDIQQKETVQMELIKKEGKFFVESFSTLNK